MAFLIAPRGPTVAPVGHCGSGFLAKLGRVRTFGRRGLPRAQNPRVGTPGRRLRHLRRVARSTEDGAVADVEGRSARRERHDVINGQVAGRVGIAPVARAPVPVLAAMPGGHPRAEALPRPGVVEGVVATAVRLPGMDGAATAGSARDHTADRAELHQARRLPAQRSTNAAAVPRLTLVTLDCTLFDVTRSVAEAAAAVYSPAVLRLRDQCWAERGHREVAMSQPTNATDCVLTPITTTRQTRGKPATPRWRSRGRRTHHR